MKKMLLISFLFIAILICGCENTPVSTTPESTEFSMPEPTETTIASVYNAPLISVSIPAKTEYFYSENETLYFSYTRQDISLVYPDQTVADAIIIDFLNRMDQYNQLALQMADAASNEYSDNTTWTPHKLDVHFSPMRIDQRILSLYGSNSSFNGGIHPEYTYISANYDMMTGDVLTLASILSGSEKSADLAQLIVEELLADPDQYALYTGFEAFVESAITTDPINNHSWYLSASGLCYYFSPYEIAPYSSGVIQVEIPYEKLDGILYNGYFPVDQDEASGTVYAQIVTGKLGGEMQLPYSSIAEVILYSNGEEMLLSTDGLVQDVRLCVGYWDDTCTIWNEQYCAFKADLISPDHAIMVQGDFSQTLPSIRLEYTSGGQQYSFFIFQSHKDGSVILEEHI